MGSRDLNKCHGLSLVRLMNFFKNRRISPIENVIIGTSIQVEVLASVTLANDVIKS